MRIKHGEYLSKQEEGLDIARYMSRGFDMTGTQVHQNETCNCRKCRRFRKFKR